jgi:hypothetical protein
MENSSGMKVKMGKVSTDITSGGGNIDATFWFNPHLYDQYFKGYRKNLVWNAFRNEWIERVKDDRDKKDYGMKAKRERGISISRYDIYELEPGDMKLIELGVGSKTVRYIDTLPEEEKKKRLRKLS